MYPTTKAVFDLQFGPSMVRPTDLHRRFALSDVRDRALLGESTVDMLFQSMTSRTKLCPQAVPVDSNGDGKGLDDRKNRFLNKTIAVAALSYRTPRTLANSMRSWNESGFLHLMNERVALLNDPLVVDRAVAASHGFELKEPSYFEGAKTSRPNVFTIGAAFYHVLTLLRSDFVVFLENDFKIDSSLSLEIIAQELLAAAGMLERGAEVVRLMSRKYQVLLLRDWLHTTLSFLRFNRIIFPVGLRHLQIVRPSPHEFPQRGSSESAQELVRLLLQRTPRRGGDQWVSV